MVLLNRLLLELEINLLQNLIDLKSQVQDPLLDPLTFGRVFRHDKGFEGRRSLCACKKVACLFKEL